MEEATAGACGALEARIVVPAPAEAVWQVYEDVPGWAQWDPDTREAWLDGPFQAGQRGRLRPRKGLVVPLRLVEAVPGQRFTVECPVLGSRMRFEHELHSDPGGVLVIHRVHFHGWLAPWLRRTVGEDLRHGLPRTLASLRRHVGARQALPPAAGGPAVTSDA